MHRTIGIICGVLFASILSSSAEQCASVLRLNAAISRPSSDWHLIGAIRTADALKGLRIAAADRNATRIRLFAVEKQSALTCFRVLPAGLGQIRLFGTESLLYVETRCSNQTTAKRREFELRVAATGRTGRRQACVRVDVDYTHHSAVSHYDARAISRLKRAVNRNAPKFTKQSYDFQVTENLNAGTFVGKVSADDADTGSAGAVVYSMRFLHDANTAGKFVIDASNGEIRTKVPLDREKMNRHEFELTARDNGSPQLEGKASLVIRVLDANDNSPVFDDASYSETIREDVDVGHQAGEVHATDLDTGSNADVIYSLVGNTDGAFVVTSTTGRILTTKSLDRETIAVYSFRAVATDRAGASGALSASVPVTITLSDVNDSPPRFDKSTYHEDVDEDVGVPRTIVTVEAKSDDLGDNARIFYNIDSGNDDGTFGIGQTTGKIFVAKPLDYETTSFYSLTVKARDGGTVPLSAFATVEIQINNVNDNAPRFKKPRYRETVRENDTPKNGFATVSAVDDDKGVLGDVTYRIDASSDVEKKFDIGRTSGDIDIIAHLDYEDKTSYQFNVIAEDGGNPPSTGQTTVTVNVIDVNDEVPQFTKTLYAEKISELAGRGTPVVKVSANDADLPLNGYLGYQIGPGPIGNPFEIDSGSGIVSVAAALDREKVDVYVFVVEATDGELTNTTQVRVTITDENDSSPVFLDTPYTTSLDENVDAGTLVYTVSADDADIGRNGNVTYSLQQTINLFRIDPKSGVIRTMTVIDYETTTYTLVRVLATDDGLSPRQTSTELSVTVLNENDNKPKFDRSPLHTIGRVKETDRIGTLALTVSASDADESGSGDQLKYSFVQNVTDFSISELSGKIRIAASLDRETVSVYHFKVQAVDSGIPPQTGVVNATIHVIDVGDNPPEFEKSVYDASVNEGSDVGTSIVRVKATSRDSSVPDSAIRYSITSGNVPPTFAIDERTGDIALAVEVDAETTPSFFLQVRAQVESRFGDVLVNVRVLDLNDNPPEILPLTIHLIIIEGFFRGTSIGRVRAVDRDSTAVLRQSLVGEMPSTFLEFENASGTIFASPGLSSGSYVINTTATDGVTTASGLTRVDVTIVSNATFVNAVTLRIVDFTRRRIVKDHLNKLRLSLAKWIPARSENIQIFSVEIVEDSSSLVDVLFAVKNDDGGFVSRGDVIGQIDLHSSAIEKESGVSFEDVNLDECLREPCKNFQVCTNHLAVQTATNPVVEDDVLFLSLQRRISHTCTCPSGYVHSWNPNSCSERIDSCLSQPCLFGGTCVNTLDGFECKCAAGIVGKTCDVPCPSLSCKLCDPNPCRNGGRCVVDENGSAFSCTCPSGYDGPLCEQATAHFDYGSLLAFSPRLGRWGFDIRLDFATVDPNGLMMHNNRLGEQYDFIALELNAGQITCSLSFGSLTETVVARSQVPLSDGEWHSVTIRLVDKTLHLTVDNCQNPDSSNDARIYEDDFICSASGTPKGNARSLDVDGPLYFGGIENTFFDHPTNNVNFSGCIRNVEIDGHLLDFSTATKNVKTVNGCPPKLSYCDSDPCKNGGTCSSVWKGYYCSCTPGHGGQQCDVSSAFQFDGQSYRHYHFSKAVFLRTFSVSFRTRQADATLLSTGRTQLQIRNGHIQLLFNVTSSSQTEGIFMNDVVAVNDGRWHSIAVTIQSGTELSLDYGRFRVIVSDVETAPVTNVYVGGKHVGPKNVVDRFSGCVDRTEINGEVVPSASGVVARKFAGVDVGVTTTVVGVTPGCPNLCDSTRCPANSVCVEPASCRCTSGHKGRQCVDVCASQPCQHGGQCAPSDDSERGFVCECASLYAGAFCETITLGKCPKGFFDYPHCRPCVCSVVGATSAICTESGSCVCEKDTYSPIDDLGCRPCECNALGAVSSTCDRATGNCECKPFVVGRACDRCADGYAGLDDDGGAETGCKKVTRVEGSVILTSEIYWSSLADVSSSQFQSLSAALSREMETLYVGLHGTQKVGISSFRRAHGEQVFVSFSIISYSDGIDEATVNELLWVLYAASEDYGSFRVRDLRLDVDCSSSPCFLTSTCSDSASRNFSCSSCPGPSFSGNGIVCIPRERLCTDDNSIDTDNDGIGDNCDNCPYVFNPQQDQCRQDDDSASCPTEMSDDVYWPRTLSGRKSSRPCPAGLVGVATRSCRNGEWQKTSLVECVSDDVERLLSLYEELERGKVLLESEAIAMVEQLRDITADSSSDNSNIEAAIRVAMGVIQYETDTVLQIENSRYATQEKLLTSLLEVISNVLMESSAYAWRRIQENGSLPGAASMMKSVEAMAVAASGTELVSSLPGGEITWAASHIALHLVSMNDRRRSFVFPSAIVALQPLGLLKRGTGVSLSADNFPLAKGVAFVAYNTLHKVLPSLFDSLGNTSGWFVNSPIISVGVSGSNLNTTKLAFPVNLTFVHTQELNRSSIECGFWNFKDKQNPEGSWSTSGCSAISTTSTSTTCQCDHLTSFAVLAADKSGSIDLDLFVIIGCCFTIGCLTVLLLVLYCSRKSNQDRIVVFANFDLAMLFTELFFVIGIGQEKAGVCVAMAVVLHFFCTAVFAWVVVEILNVYYIVSAKDSEKTKIPYYLGVGWGFPALIVAITVGIRLNAYEGNLYCFLTLDDDVIWAFGVVAVLAIAAFFIIFCMIFDGQKKLRKRSDADDEKLPSIKLPLVGSVLTLITLIVLFAIGYFYLPRSSSSLKYAFGTFNILLGFVFLACQILQVSKLVKAKKSMQNKRGHYHVSSAQPSRSILSGNLGHDRSNRSVSFTGTYKSHGTVQAYPVANPMYGHHWDHGEQSYDEIDNDREEDWDEDALHQFPISQLQRHQGDGADCVDVMHQDGSEEMQLGNESISDDKASYPMADDAGVTYDKDWFEDEDFDNDKPPLEDVAEEPEEFDLEEIHERSNRGRARYPLSAVDSPARTKGTYLQSPVHKSSEEKTTVSPMTVEMSPGIEAGVVVVRQAIETSSRESSIPHQKPLWSMPKRRDVNDDDDDDDSSVSSSSSSSSSSADSMSLGRNRRPAGSGKGRRQPPPPPTSAKQRRRHVAAVDAGGQMYGSGSSLHSDFSSSGRRHQRKGGSIPRHNSDRRKYGRRMSPGGAVAGGGSRSRSQSTEATPRRYKVPRFDEPAGQISTDRRRKKDSRKEVEITTKSDVSTAV